MAYDFNALNGLKQVQQVIKLILMVVHKRKKKTKQKKNNCVQLIKLLLTSCIRQRLASSNTIIHGLQVNKSKVFVAFPSVACDHCFFYLSAFGWFASRRVLE